MIKLIRLFSNTIFSLLIFSILTGCGGESKKENKKNKQEQVATPEENQNTLPNGIISLEKAKTLCTNYEERRGDLISKYETSQIKSDKDFVPTQFIEFDIKTLKKYIKYVERKASKAKIKPDSLRIYLGNYGKEGEDPYRNTVFMLPTATIDGNHGGFYIEKDGNAKLIRDYWTENKNEEGKVKSEAGFLSAFIIQGGGESLILNSGHGGPPPTGDFE